MEVSGLALGRVWACWLASSPHLYEQLTGDEATRSIAELGEALTHLMRSGSGDRYLFFDL